MDYRKLIIRSSFILMLLAALFIRVLLPQDSAEGATPTPPPAGLPYAARGPHMVGTRALALGGERSLPVTIWYPTTENGRGAEDISYPYEIKIAAPLGSITIASFSGQAIPEASYDLTRGPYPLAILSPGFALGGRSYAWLGEHLATYGFVVIAPEHQETLNPGLMWQAAIERPLDIRALLAAVDEQTRAGGAFSGLIDPEHTAVIGHSLGGYTALAAAGARIDSRGFQALCAGARQAEDPNVWLCDMLLPHVIEMAELAGLSQVPAGLWPAWDDTDLDAVVPLAGDAFLFDQAGLAEITVPVLAMGGTSDSDSPYHWGTQPTYEFASSARKARVALQDAEHMIFTGPCETIPWYAKIAINEFCADAVWDRNQAHEMIKHFTTAFLLAELKQDGDATSALAPDAVNFPGISYEAEGY